MFRCRIAVCVVSSLLFAPSARANATCRVVDSDISTEFSGPCVAGFAHGRGHASGRDTYDGDFVSGKKHGQGIYVWGAKSNVPGVRYEGAFLDDKRTGQGTLTYPNGMRYRGDFREGKFHGKGVLTSPTGLVTSGEFVNNEFAAHVAAKKVAAERAAKASALAQRYGAIGFVDITLLAQNPFAIEGQTFILVTSLSSMLSKNEGIFNLDRFSGLLASGVPSSAFVDSRAAVLVFKVLGRSKTAYGDLPHVRYVAHQFCVETACAEYVK